MFYHRFSSAGVKLFQILWQFLYNDFTEIIQYPWKIKRFTVNLKCMNIIQNNTCTRKKWQIKSKPSRQKYRKKCIWILFISTKQYKWQQSILIHNQLMFIWTWYNKMTISISGDKCDKKVVEWMNTLNDSCLMDTYLNQKAIYM